MKSFQTFLFAAILLVVAAILASIASSPVEAVYGADVSGLFSTSNYECARKEYGWDFLIARGFHSYGAVDPNGGKNLDAAKAAGIAHRDLYFFPCYAPGRKSAKQQVTEFYNYYKSYLDTGSMMWFDIETNASPGCQYAKGIDSCTFMAELIEAARGLQIHSGIYSSEYEWGTVMGASCTAGSSRGQQLWVANYNGVPGDNGPLFGGWTRAVIHQYEGTTNGCGISFDKNYYP